MCKKRRSYQSVFRRDPNLMTRINFQPCVCDKVWQSGEAPKRGWFLRFPHSFSMDKNNVIRPHVLTFLLFTFSQSCGTSYTETFFGIIHFPLIFNGWDIFTLRAKTWRVITPKMHRTGVKCRAHIFLNRIAIVRESSEAPNVSQCVLDEPKSRSLIKTFPSIPDQDARFDIFTFHVFSKLRD